MAGLEGGGTGTACHSPFYKSGYLPARTHGWNSTMAEYNLEAGVYEYGYQIGHRASFRYGPASRSMRDAGNRGLHVNMDKDRGFDQLKAKSGVNDLVYVNDYLKGYNGGVVGNGYQRYVPDLTAGKLAQGAETYENLVNPPLRLPSIRRWAGRPGSRSLRWPPLLYLGGRIHASAFRKSAADRVTISFSTNSGRDYFRMVRRQRLAHPRRRSSLRIGSCAGTTIG